MILQNKIKVLINRDPFLLHHYHIYLEKEQKETVRSYDVNVRDFRKHMMATMGEYFEREVLANNRPLKDNYVYGVNLIDGTIEKFLTEDFLFGEKFLDSCGMASHFLSESAVLKAYLEFFGRQSLIANYLYGIPGTKVSYEGEEEIEAMDKYIKNYVEYTDYYNVSLSSNIKVIIALCWSKDRKAVGMGTSFDIKEAILKSQQEVLQYFAVDCRKIDENAEKQECKDIYLNQFNSFTTEMMLDTFRHLFIGNDVASIEDLNTKEKNICLKNILLENYKYLGMRPFVVMFSSRELSPVKVVKVFDYRWFPHMRPGLYSEVLIENIGNRLNRKRVNYSDWIPFA